MSTITVTASNARKTTTGASYRGVDGTDVDVRVTLPHGDTISGEVTLLPREDGREGLAAWGMAPDHWVSGKLLQALKDTFDGDDFSDALNELEAAAAKVAG